VLAKVLLTDVKYPEVSLSFCLDWTKIL